MCIAVLLVPFTPVAEASNIGLNTYNEVTKTLSDPENYIQYLESFSCSKLNQVLKQFSDLPEEEQELFLKIMQPDNYIQILDLAGYDDNTFGSLEIDGLEIPFSVVPESGTRVINNTSIVVSSAENTQSVASRSTRREFTARQDFTVLRIKATTLWSTLIFTVNSNNRPISTTNASGRHSNWNPGLIVTGGSSTHFMDHGIARGETAWRFNATAGAGFISHSTDLQTRRNGTTNQMRIVSGRSSFNSSWRNI